MPRLTNRVYYQRYLLLRRLWQEYPRSFTVLDVGQQWDVHAYYQPTKQLTEVDLITHRREISLDRPSLRARAGKAFNGIAAPRGRAHPVHPGAIRSKRRIAVHALAKPEPDLQQLARAFISLAEDLAAKERS